MPVVLIAEDEALIRMMIADVLQEAGLHVVEAVDATEALALLEARDDVDVLVTDVRMPGALDGLALARLVAQIRRETGILVCSGHATPKADELPAGARFLAKPYRPDALLRELRGLLDARDTPIAPATAVVVPGTNLTAPGLWTTARSGEADEVGPKG